MDSPATNLQPTLIDLKVLGEVVAQTFNPDLFGFLLHGNADWDASGVHPANAARSSTPEGGEIGDIHTLRACTNVRF